MSSIAFEPSAFTASGAKPSAAGVPGTPGSPANGASSQTSLSSLGGTFMQLLVQELQNQDPTAPMDSTQMVGQMISLNELDQVASINQLLTTKLGSSPTSTQPTGHAVAAANRAAAQPTF